MKLLLTLAAAILSGTTLTSCSVAASPQNAPPPSLVDQSTYTSQIRETFDDFPWPPDYRPDLDQLIIDSGPGQNELFSSEDARLTLSVISTCAWFLSWDAARQRGDLATATSTLTVIDEQRDRLSSAMDQNGRDFVRHAVERAHVDDPAPARQYTTANCDQTAWISP